MYTAELAAALLIQYEQNVLGLSMGECHQLGHLKADL